MVPLKTAKADLIGKYKLHLKISFIISISLVILAFKFSPMPGKIKPIKVDDDGIIKVTEIDPTTQKPKVPDPPKAPEIIVANIDDNIEDLILTDVGIDKNSNLGKPDPFVDKPVLDDENIIHIVVEEMPTIIGGYETLYKKLYYTEIARRAGITGTIVVEAIIDKEGNPTDIKIVQSLGGGLDDVALSAVKDLQFTPGIQSGKPVRVRISIPIKFVLK